MRTLKQNLKKRARPKYLDLRQIKLPVTGIVSIAHRISGILLVLSIPVWLYLLELSLSGPLGFEEAIVISNGFFFTVLSIGCFWSLVHHFVAGIRYLLIDLDIGVDKEAALEGARWVFIVEGAIMLPVIGWLL